MSLAFDSSLDIPLFALDTGLVIEAASGNIERVRLLLEKGANVHAEEDHALRYSAEYGRLEMVRLLLEKGADIHARDDEALRYSAMNGHLEVVRLLLEKGANIRAYEDETLRLSAKNGHIEVVRLLLEKGANINAREHEALCFSARNGHYEVVRLLLEYGSWNDSLREIDQIKHLFAQCGVWNSRFVQYPILVQWRQEYRVHINKLQHIILECRKVSVPSSVLDIIMHYT